MISLIKNGSQRSLDLGPSLLDERPNIMVLEAGERLLPAICQDECLSVRKASFSPSVLSIAFLRE